MPSVTVTHRYAHSPEKVFDAWLDPKLARRFLFTTETGEVVRCDIDPRVGGRYTITDRRPPDDAHMPDGGDIVHVGEYLEIDRPRRLVFTFAVPQFDPSVTRVTVEIAPDGDGCILTLTNDDLTEEWMAPTTEGWTMILGALERAL
ncbi:SRPBCC domain-containing protein [Phenylobacterium sp. J426]|uniref:SRPBCC family protein n=1 Tax=Phenylobacterium sp. J426 TaxID=2898439 RepID=UPI0021515F4E|nr:SRPBCC domain-containing protein [Phenylobacterium sp. J426]MCR5873022.1 SRPBCC domain-containing protein [Phenylobacterium sp. J426]